MILALLLLKALTGLRFPFIAALFSILSLLFAAVCGLHALRHLRRARRIMAAEGQQGGHLRAAVWAFENGDFAIRLAYLTMFVLAGLMAIQLFAYGPSGLIYSAGACSMLLITLSTLLRHGHMGEVRLFPSRTVSWHWSLLFFTSPFLVLGITMSVLLFKICRWQWYALGLPLLIFYVSFAAAIGFLWVQATLRRAERLTRALKARRSS